MSSTGSAITQAGTDFGEGLAAVAQVAGGAFLLLLGILLVTGLNRGLTRTAIRVAKVVR